MWCKDTCLLEARSQQLKKDTSCSGILIHPRHNFIVTHSTFLVPFCTKKTVREINDKGFIHGTSFQGTEVRVTIQSINKDCENDDKYELTNKALEMKSLKSYTNVTLKSSLARNERELQHFNSSIVMMWKAEKFGKTLTRLMPKSDGWILTDDGVFGDEKGKKKQEATEIEDIAFQLLPCFVLLKLNDDTGHVNFKKIDVLPAREVKRGMTVNAVGTPFGNLSPDVFMNCVSRGILCNTVGSGNELLLTDARCIPGSEGGVLYSPKNERQALIGMIVSPLCWKNNEWVVLAVGCSMSEILGSLQNVAENDDLIRVNKLNDSTMSGNMGTNQLISHLPVVLVQYGFTWGTGILLNDGVVVTCSHVVKFNKKAKVKVKLFLSDIPMWLNGSVVFSSPEGAVFDVAIIQLTSEVNILRPPCWTIATVTEGMPVHMIGHGLFGERHELKPSVMKGNVAKVARVNGIPVMIQSTCAVSAGASGGPLVDNSGKLVAMVTCNAKDQDSGVTFPHINMAVPASIFWPIVQEFIKTKDSSVLSQLHIRNQGAEKLWNLKTDKRHTTSLL